MFNRASFYIILLFLLTFLKPIQAQVVVDENLLQNGVWDSVSVSYTVPDKMNVNQGQAAIIALARKKLIEKVTGFEIKSFSVLSTRESNFNWAEDYQRLIISESNGKIVEERLSSIRMTNEGGKTVLHIDNYVGLVKPDLTEQDLNFKIEAYTDKEVYKVGEKINLNIKSSLDAYITIFSIAADGKVAMFLPNKFKADNFIFGNEGIDFPDKVMNKVFDMVAKEGSKTKAPFDELFLVVATKKQLQFTDLARSFYYYTDIVQVNKWLMGMPRDQRTSTFVSYKVVK